MMTYTGYTPRQVPRLMAAWDDDEADRLLRRHANGPVPVPPPSEAPKPPPELPPPIVPPVEEPPPDGRPVPPVQDPPVNAPVMY